MEEAHLPTQSVRRVTEVSAPDLPALVHPEWRDCYPWLVQGTTTREGADGVFDLGLFSGGSSADTVSANWRLLAERTGCGTVHHAKQVHGSDVALHATSASRSGPTTVPSLAGPCDGHVSSERGVLLTVATADCVPVFAFAASGREGADGPCAAVFHAGWRGVVAGVVERGIERMVLDAGADAAGIRVHLGPAICGACYEVGPEVFQELGLPAPNGPTPIDLRSVIGARLRAVGIGAVNLTMSSHCTRCTGSDLFSHRGGDRGRQVGFIGIRAPQTVSRSEVP